VARPDPGGRKIGLAALTAATFFIVSGGPYGTEEIVRGHGYGGALVLLVLVPLVWSLPVGLLVGELGAALPHTGGFTVWVTRGLGPFWGLQEGWLSAVVGLVGLAIYPTLMVGYLARLWPALGDIARAQGMARIARKSGLGRESLYKALSAEGNPEFATVMKVIRSLGLQLQVRVG